MTQGEDRKARTGKDFSPPTRSVQQAEMLIGACLEYADVQGEALRQLVPADFGWPNLANAFEAVRQLHEEGLPATDPRNVVERLRQLGTCWDQAEADLTVWKIDAPMRNEALASIANVSRASAKHRLWAFGATLACQAADPTLDPDDLLDQAKADLAGITSLVGVPSPGDLTDDELLAEPAEEVSVVVPGAITFEGRQRPPLICQDDRANFVGPEGAGKTLHAQQLLVCASFGLHPYNPAQAIEPVPCLAADFENPRQDMRDRLRRLETLAERHSHHRAPFSLWLEPGGIDLRKRADRIAFEDVLRRRRPRLVAFGPIYKSYSRKASENDEQVANEVQAVLDDLRTRYGFAILLEHHAGHGEYGSREMRPFGSSLWLRWSEFGIGLIAAYKDLAGNLRPVRGGRVKRVPDALFFDRFRGDRRTGSWPARIDRGDHWPWLGYYEERW